MAPPSRISRKLITALCESYTESGTLRGACAVNTLPWRTFLDWQKRGREDLASDEKKRHKSLHAELVQQLEFARGSVEQAEAIAWRKAGGKEWMGHAAFLRSRFEGYEQKAEGEAGDAGPIHITFNRAKSVKIGDAIKAHRDKTNGKSGNGTGDNGSNGR